MRNKGEKTMSKAETDRMDALMGGANGPTGAATGGVSKDEFERTQHELDVMRGRTKTLDARLKELEKENAELRASQNRDEIILSALSEEERNSLDPAFVSAMAKVSAATEVRLRKEYEERDRQTAAEREARMQEAKVNFARQIESAFPGFLASIGEGGDKNAQWREFCGVYGASVNAAYARFDVNAISTLIKQFQSSLGIRVPSGSQGKATSPDPRNLGSGTVAQPTNGSKVYTQEEYAALEKQAMAARRRGDYDTYRKLDEELNNILAEGRVKD